MKARRYLLLFTPSLFFVVLALALPLLSGQQKAKPNIPAPYRAWLEEEVVYIITPTERDVFGKLQTDRERDIFVEAFWKHRDPTPGTAANEFRDEHYGRLKYANENFSRGTPRPGWMTDQGRIHVILGPPRNIEEFAEINGVYPVKIWSYAGDPDYGLPTGFNIIFFKKHGMGEYVLYSPVDDGPESLIADWGTGLTAEYLQEGGRQLTAYQQLVKLAPNLAYQTLSLIPGERVMSGTASLASTRLLGAVFSYPQKKVEDEYAEALLKYKDVIEVDYSANYIASEASLGVLRSDAGYFMVHYAVEPRKISVDSYGDKFSANFELDGRVTDEKGNTVFQFTKDLPLSFTAAELKDLQAKSLAIQDFFPVVPGNYRFDLLLKNTVSKEFTSFEGAISIPEDGALPAISSLLLGYKVDKSAAPDAAFIPFRTKEGLLLAPARKTFSQKESLHVFFQVPGLPAELRSAGRVKFAILRREAPFLDQQKAIGDYANVPDFLDVFPLREWPPDYYKIRVSILDARGAELLAQDEDFEITAAPEVSRPLVVSKIRPHSGTEEYDYDVGLQLLNLKRTKEALVFLEKAYLQNSGELRYALGLSRGLFIEAQYQRVKEVLGPFKEDKASDVVLYFLAKAVHSLGENTEAVVLYTDYLSRFGLNLEILNLLGTAHYQLGHAAEALRAWQRSLEVNPNQENIRKLVQSLQEKK